MRYYIIVKKEKIYFSYDYAWLRDVQKYLLDNRLRMRKLHISMQ